MKTTFTKQEMSQNKGCYSEEELSNCSFMKNDSVSIHDIINSEIPTEDKGWFIARKCELTLDEKRAFAIGCAKVVLEIFEKKYPEDKSPRKAIEAAEAVLKDQSRENRKAADAADAAYAAYAAYAADAAYAAAAAAAAYAAAADDAAYAAAAAAYAAAADDSYNKKLVDFFNEFFS